MSKFANKRLKELDPRKWISEAGKSLKTSLRDTKLKIGEELHSSFWGELRSRPNKFVYLFESVSPKATQLALNIALESSRFFRRSPSYSLWDWNGEVLTAAISVSPGFGSRMEASHITYGAEKTLRLFWERYMLSGSDRLTVTEVRLNRLGEWGPSLKIRYGLTAQDRERIRVSQGQRGLGEYDLSLSVLNDQDLLVAEVGFKIEWQTRLSLGV
jgi:hypothetical protein